MDSVDTTNGHTNITSNLKSPLDISDDLYASLDIFVNVFVLQVLSWLGVVGNSLNLIVLSRHGMRSTTNLILLYLSVADLVYVLMSLCSSLPVIASYLNFYVFITLSSFYYQLFYVIRVVALVSSTYYTTLLALERMIAVCFPFQVSRIVTPFRIHFSAILICLILTALQSPYYAIVYLHEINIDNVTTILVIEQSRFYSDNYEFLQKFYFTVFLNLYSMAIPTFVVSMSTIITLVKVRKSTKSVQQMSESRMEKRVKDMRSVKTSLLLSTSLIFCVLVPSGIIESLATIDESVFQQISEKALALLISAEQILYIINSSFNFLLYVVTSRKFSGTLKTLFMAEPKVKR